MSKLVYRTSLIPPHKREWRDNAMQKLCGFLILLFLINCAYFNKSPKRTNQSIDGIIYLDETNEQNYTNNVDSSSVMSVHTEQKKKNQKDTEEVRDFDTMSGIYYVEDEKEANEILKNSYNSKYKKIEFGKASYYATKFEGNKTASGEIYDPNKMTAAHPTFPFGTIVRVMNLYNNKIVIVRINDRGPKSRSRIIELSYAAAQKLGFGRRQVAHVAIEVIESPY